MNLDRGNGSQAEGRGGQERILGIGHIDKGHWGWGGFLIKGVVSCYLVRTRGLQEEGQTEGRLWQAC